MAQFGLGPVMFVQKPADVPAATVQGANNGLSLSGTNAQLGQAVGAAGNPGVLLSNREIPMGGFSINFNGNNLDVLIDDANRVFKVANGAGNPRLFVDLVNNLYQLGNIDTGVFFEINDSSQFIRIKHVSNGAQVFVADAVNCSVSIGSTSSYGNKTKLTVDDANRKLNVVSDVAGNAQTFLLLDMNLQNYYIGDVSGSGNATRVFVDDSAAQQIINLVANNGIKTNNPNGANTAGKWKLGKKKAGAVALDAANYVEVNIEGVVVKLGIVV